MTKHRITVEAAETAAGWRCQVSVKSPQVVHRYTLHVSRAQLERYGKGRSVLELACATFEFLLAREPPQSILREFDLSVVEGYFPEFPHTI
ncbi:MAG: hypothetical protein ACRENY_07950 [Candidatus Dormibacteria bacterium]